MRGPIQIVGTATHKAFRYYKLEYTQGADVNASFSYLTGGETPVVNGVLADFYSYTVPNGAYTLRLTVVDASGNYPPPCTVTIAIRN